MKTGHIRLSQPVCFQDVPCRELLPDFEKGSDYTADLQYTRHCKADLTLVKLNPSKATAPYLAAFPFLQSSFSPPENRDNQIPIGGRLPKGLSEICREIVARWIKAWRQVRRHGPPAHRAGSLTTKSTELMICSRRNIDIEWALTLVRSL